ncbi:ChuX/HutX family heme-like substrate-binding protein [Comamonas sp. JC664]|uniref:hemin-degrading factor n=1 Tax=Comamonas sp. JC664 TaxID=2801917 RepID=UPI0017496D10|nr:ChuX/HutX family heme-like substrate-binding protein [Comamonas sp. JC664]MBL0697632.1 hemin-degrading factor [Comamonas sp. JC664]
MIQTANSESVSEPSRLRQRWQTLREEQPRTRIRDAAEQLGVSEAQLLATGLGETVVRLDLRLDALLPRFESLGRVMSLTRNAHAVHEKRGTWRNVELHGKQGLVLDEDIDLRLFFSRWTFGFAIREPHGDGIRRSLQFFDASGMAIHKVYVEEAGREETFDALVKEFTHAEQSPVLDIVPAKAPTAPKPDSEIDATGLREGWRALQDTHEFFMLLNRFGVARTQALRLAQPELTTAVSPSALTWVLEKASAAELPIMIFVGNPGCIQIHTGPVKNVKPMGPWMNVLDPAFNLHVRADNVASAWVVRKPTRDGVVTSVELFDADGENIALIFGKRKPGQAESPEWRALAEALAKAIPAREVA